MSDIFKLEPFPLESGQRWETGSKEYERRLIYIQARTEAYFDNYRTSVDYDFMRTDAAVETAQKRLNKSFEQWAEGLVTLDTVKEFAVFLRDAFKRREKPNVFEEFKNKRKNQDRQRPGSLYINGVRATFGERLDFWIKENCKRIYFQGETPPPGIASVRAEGFEGYLADGSKVGALEAEIAINGEVRALLVEKFGEKAYAQDQEPQTPQKSEEIETKNKNLDKLREEIEKTKRKKQLSKRR